MTHGLLHDAGPVIYTGLQLLHIALQSKTGLTEYRVQRTVDDDRSDGGSHGVDGSGTDVPGKGNFCSRFSEDEQLSLIHI